MLYYQIRIVIVFPVISETMSFQRPNGSRNYGRDHYKSKWLMRTRGSTRYMNVIKQKKQTNTTTKNKDKGGKTVTVTELLNTCASNFFQKCRVKIKFLSKSYRMKLEDRLKTTIFIRFWETAHLPLP